MNRLLLGLAVFVLAIALQGQSCGNGNCGGGGAQVYPQAQTCSATAQTLSNATWTTICTITFTALGTSTGPSAAWRVRVYASGGSTSQVNSDAICITGASAGTLGVGTATAGAAAPTCPTNLATATNPLAGSNRGTAGGAGVGVPLQVEYSAQYANGTTPAFNCQLAQATGNATNGCTMYGLAEPI